jgi:hypothetical protein
MYHLKALSRFRYAGGQIEIGDEFDAPPGDGLAFILVGIAEEASQPKKPTPKNAKPEDDEPPPMPGKPDHDQRYRTRRLKADDD